MKKRFPAIILLCVLFSMPFLTSCDPQASATAVTATARPAATEPVPEPPAPEPTPDLTALPEPSASEIPEPTEEPQESLATQPSAEPSEAQETVPAQEPSAETGSTPVAVAINSGPIQGLQQEGISVYKGIPYAKPPVGDLRFAPPEDVEPWTEPLDCTVFGPTPIQATPKEEMPMSEDCLTVNVWSPADSADEKLPVYVWIYGGAFAAGSGAESAYDGTAFAKDGIVTVTFNYRVNAFGFYATQETYNQYGTTGNWGLLDQIKALEWVQDNIGAFGGDPDKVTIGGESAGSYSVSAFITSPLTEGLFQSAIMESGSVLGIPGNNYYSRGNLQHSIELCNMMSYEFGATDDATGLQKMRTANADVITQLCPLTVDFTTTPAFFIIPVFDGHVVPVDVYGALQNGQFNNVNLLWGFNADEGAIFVPGDTNQQKYEMLASRMFGYDQSQSVLERFPVNDQYTSGDRARQILAYGMFTAVMKPFGDALAAGGQNVYAYQFNYVTAENAEAGLGAHHGSEIDYAFGNLKNSDAEQQQLSNEMHTRWVNFIKNGDPNVGDTIPSVEWPKYNAQDSRMLIFDKEITTGAMPGKDDIDFMVDIMFGAGQAYYQ